MLSIIAGPIGSGKSTFISGSDGLVGEVIRLEQLGDVDRSAFDKSMELVSREQSFVLETDLTQSAVTELVETAKAGGYKTKLSFIGVASPELAKARASDQYLDIDKDVLDNNWKQSLSGSGVIIDLVDDTTLVDNSTNEGFRAVAQLTSDNYTFSDAPEWATDAALSAAQVQLEKASDVAQMDKATELAVSAARAGGVDEAQLKELSIKPSQSYMHDLKDDGYDL